MFSGKMSSTTSCHVRGCVVGSAAVATVAGRAMPSPARLRVIATQPMASASVVTTSK